MADSVLELGPIERKSLNQLTYERLKRALLSGGLDPASIYTLRKLATELKVSVMPVREAVGRLVAEQALEILPNRGIRIPALSPANWNEIWELRIELESKLVGYAALNATPEDLKVIQADCARVRKAAEAGLLREALEANSDFQFAIFQAARTRVLISFVETLRMQSAPHCVAAQRVLVDGHPFLERTLGYHDEIVEAISKGNSRIASSTKQLDIEELRAFVEEVTPR